MFDLTPKGFIPLINPRVLVLALLEGFFIHAAQRGCAGTDFFPNFQISKHFLHVFIIANSTFSKAFGKDPAESDVHEAINSETESEEACKV